MKTWWITWPHMPRSHKYCLTKNADSPNSWYHNVRGMWPLCDKSNYKMSPTKNTVLLACWIMLIVIFWVDIMQSCKWLLTFQETVSPPSSGLNEGDIFLETFGNHLKDYMASQPRRPHSWYNEWYPVHKQLKCNSTVWSFCDPRGKIQCMN